MYFLSLLQFCCLDFPQVLNNSQNNACRMLSLCQTLCYGLYLHGLFNQISILHLTQCAKKFVPGPTTGKHWWCNLTVLPSHELWSQLLLHNIQLWYFLLLWQSELFWCLENNKDSNKWPLMDPSLLFFTGKFRNLFYYQCENCVACKYEWQF